MVGGIIFYSSLIAASHIICLTPPPPHLNFLKLIKLWRKACRGTGGNNHVSELPHPTSQKIQMFMFLSFWLSGFWRRHFASLRIFTPTLRTKELCHRDFLSQGRWVHSSPDPPSVKSLSHDDDEAEDYAYEVQYFQSVNVDTFWPWTLSP
jgi:hypothetical protein